jgi:hypothetical protein
MVRASGLAATFAAVAACGGCASILGVDQDLALSDAGDAGEAGEAGDAGDAGDASDRADASDGATTGDTGGGDAGDGRAARNVGTDANLTEIRCGTTACDPISQVCCIGSDTSLSCAPNHGNSCRQGAEIRCDDNVQCGVGVCCINIGLLGVVLGTTCAASCPDDAGDQWMELCNPQREDCAKGSCVALTLEPSPPLTAGWFHACQ